MSEEKPEVTKRSLTITFSSFTMFTASKVRTSKPNLRLIWACTNGYPNISVETDEEGEATKENGWLKVSARLNATNFYGALSLIRRALKEAPGWKMGIECFHTYKDGQYHDKPVKVCDLVVGNDSQGLVYITVLQAGRTTTKFVFGPTEWHNYRDSEGNNLTQKEINHICAAETANGLTTAMGAAMALDAIDYQNTRTPMTASTRNDKGEGGDKPAGGYNNGGGGYQKKPWNGGNGGGGGGYQKKQWQGGGGGGYNNNNGGGGGYQKKPYNNGNGGGGNGYSQQSNSAPQQNSKQPPGEFEDINV